MSYFTSLQRTAAPAITGAAFVWLTSSSLPAVVASHFGPGGLPDGFSPQRNYVSLVLTLVIVAPLVVRTAGLLARVNDGALLNIPNKHFWLEPERREETLAYIHSRLNWVADALVLFLCYVHWLVVRANAKAPVQLSSRALAAGIALLGTFAVFSVLSLYRRFRVRG